MKMTAIESYRIIIEFREELERVGHVLMTLADGGEARTPGMSYTELASFAELLRSEPDLDWDDSERIVQRQAHPVGRRGGL